MRFVTLASGCALMMSADVSVAQLDGKPYGPPPASIPNRRMSEEDRARKTTLDFARCILARYPQQVQAAITEPDSTSGDRSLRKLADSDCLSDSTLEMPAPIFRGSLYRALYIRDFGKQPPAKFEANIDYVAQMSGNPLGRERLILKAYASCVARMNPDGARALVLADVASKPEAEAIRELRPTLGACLKDGTVRFSKGVLQGNIAEVLYRDAVGTHAGLTGTH